MEPLKPFKAPPTEGIKYAGSKLKLLPHILALASKTNSRTFFDGFAGTTRVSQAFAQSGYKVTLSDRAHWSKVFGNCYLKNTIERSYYDQIIQHLNHLKPTDGWFTENYGGLSKKKTSVGSDGLKKPFQIHNTRKLDAIRQEITHLDLSEIEESVLLASLILALDKVDNTLGHYAAYLTDWSPRSYKNLELTVPQLIKTGDDHDVFRGDIFETIKKTSVDLAYLDPPYGSNNEKMPPSRVRYSAYYHIWTSVVLNDTPKTFGKAKRRSDTSDLHGASVFEEFRKTEEGNFIAVEALDRLISEINANYVILSYSSGGRATAGELFDILEKSGKILELVKIDYKRNVMGSMRWTNEWVKDSNKPNEEFLFLIEKS